MEVRLEKKKLLETRIALCHPGYAIKSPTSLSKDIFQVWCYQNGVQVYPVYSKAPYVPLVSSNCDLRIVA